MRRRHRHGERGMTLIEVLAASVVLLVAMTGFVGVIHYAATATSVAHRRTGEIFLRGGLIDRLAVSPRSALAWYPSDGTFVVDGCYDVDLQLVARNPTPAYGFVYSSAFDCSGTSIPTTYRSKVSVVPNIVSPGTSWRVSVYVERMDMSCDPNQRYSSVGCAAADFLLTD